MSDYRRNPLRRPNAAQNIRYNGNELPTVPTVPSNGPRTLMNGEASTIPSTNTAISAPLFTVQSQYHIQPNLRPRLERYLTIAIAAHMQADQSVYIKPDGQLAWSGGDGWQSQISIPRHLFSEINVIPPENSGIPTFSDCLLFDQMGRGLRGGTSYALRIVPRQLRHATMLERTSIPGTTVVSLGCVKPSLCNSVDATCTQPSSLYIKSSTQYSGYVLEGDWTTIGAAAYRCRRDSGRHAVLDMELQVQPRFEVPKYGCGLPDGLRRIERAANSTSSTSSD